MKLTENSERFQFAQAFVDAQRANLTDAYEVIRQHTPVVSDVTRARTRAYATHSTHECSTTVMPLYCGQ
jgi:hypothetical protein